MFYLKNNHLKQKRRKGRWIHKFLLLQRFPVPVITRLISVRLEKTARNTLNRNVLSQAVRQKCIQTHPSNSKVVLFVALHTWLIRRMSRDLSLKLHILIQFSKWNKPMFIYCYEISEMPFFFCLNTSRAGPIMVKRKEFHVVF